MIAEVVNCIFLGTAEVAEDEAVAAAEESCAARADGTVLC